MKLKIFIFLFFTFFNLIPQKLEQPKLIVGIVVDQMRFDDLYRFYDYFEENGFKELIRSGANFTFAHYNYEPTTTAPGHASIYTGSLPHFTGIIANEFFDKSTKKIISAVVDEDYNSVGSNDNIGQCSPKKLLASTITDQIRLFTNLQSKVIAISLKDRGAVLPGGHLANAAYWYNYKTGDFITSSYYMKNLPDWLVSFNEKKLPENYMKNGWTLLLRDDYYKFISELTGEIKTQIFKEEKSFPYRFTNLSKDELYIAFQFTPYANQIIVDLAKEVIKNENLGKNNYPDFLSISFSATDIIGHNWGNYSNELMDTYLRLDKSISEFIYFLNESIGKGNYLMFLTSDHGAIETPSFLEKINFSIGELNTKTFFDSLKSFATTKFGSDKIILNFSNRQIYLDREFIEKNNLKFEDVEQSLVNYLRGNFNAIQNIMTRSNLEKLIGNRIPHNTLLNGWHPVRSGDIIFNLRPAYLNNYLKNGTTHNSAYSYDTHIPLIFYGWKIPSKTINHPVYITDIAATLANLLKINQPNACVGIPLSTYWEE